MNHLFLITSNFQFISSKKKSYGFSYYILMSFVIYYCTNARQHGIYLFTKLNMTVVSQLSIWSKNKTIKSFFVISSRVY